MSRQAGAGDLAPQQGELTQEVTEAVSFLDVPNGHLDIVQQLHLPGGSCY